MLMNTPQKWLNQAPDGKKFAAAILAGLLLELGGLALVLTHLAKPPPPAQIPATVRITIVAPPAPKPPPPQPTPPKPVTPPQPITPPKPLLPPPPRPLPRPVAQHVIHHVVPPRPLLPPPKVIQPPTPPTPPAPPQPAVISQGAVDMFRLAMRAAVQAVADQVYPSAAHEAGAPVVSFVYDNGIVSNIALVTSCGFPLLDAAAMQAVRIAHYPPAPDEFHGQAETVTVAVIFRPAAASVDGD